MGVGTPKNGVCALGRRDTRRRISLPCEDTASRWPSTNEDEGLKQKPTTPAPDLSFQPPEL